MRSKRPGRTLCVVKNLSHAAVSRGDATPLKHALASMSTSVILDQHGCIRSCGQGVAALARLAAQALDGQSIKALLPTLPFQPGTPGYNVAFAVFHANNKRHTVCRMNTGDGVPLVVEVALTVLETAPAYLFSVEIRKHASLAVVATYDNPPGQQQALFQRRA